MMNGRRTATLTALTTAAAATGAGLALLAAPALADVGSSPERPDGRGMSSMQGGSPAGNPGMQRMHELMQDGNPGMQRMHELMLQQDPGMDQMHRSMPDGPR